MHHFAYRQGVLYAEDVNLAELADDVGTPLYCYSQATLERHYRVFAEAFAGADALVCYSVKANSSLAVLATLAKLGAGMDVVSEGELRRALAVGVDPSKIAFSGVGKTKAEMSFALEHGIFAFNVESAPELQLLSETAAELGLAACVALRVNPDVDAKTHHKIATGKAENKFGIPFAEALPLYRLARELPGIEAHGVHMHIGSQITDLDPFRNAFALLKELVGELRAQGFTIDFINLGGGLGVPYRRRSAAPAGTRRIRGAGASRGRRSRLQALVRAWPHDRRQCRYPHRARARGEGRRRQELHYRRRGDERSDAADAVRGLSRDLAGEGA